MQRNMNKRQGQMLGSGAGAMGLAEAGYILYQIVIISTKKWQSPKVVPIIFVHVSEIWTVNFFSKILSHPPIKII